MVINDLQPLAYATSSVTFVIGLTTFFLRWYTRISVLKTWGLDDWISVLVFVCSVVQQTILYMFLYYGCGLHVATLDPETITQITKWLFIEEVFYYLIHFVIKSAFLFFYFRLSSNRTFRLFVYLACGTNAAIFLINTLMAFFQCIPFDEIFHPGTHSDAICIPKAVLLLLPSILNIFQDLFILILPIHTVWILQMTLRRKIAVLSVLGFGTSAVLVASLRIMPLLELNSSPDVSFVLGKMVIVAAFEIQLAIVAVNLPSLKALWTKITGGSSAGTKGYKNGYMLSSMEGGRHSIANKKKSRRGSVTALERGIISNESEEELWKQQAAIKVTRMAELQTTKDAAGRAETEKGHYGVAKLMP